jgi:hypothetical protein
VLIENKSFCQLLVLVVNAVAGLSQNWVEKVPANANGAVVN